MRLQLTQASDLAVRVLMALGRAEERRKATELAPEIGTTAGLLPQIMRPLLTAGWVDSQRGPTGGYGLLADLEEVDVLAVIEAVEGPTDTTRCVLVDGACQPELPCALHDPWRRARGLLMAELSATSVADLRRSRPNASPAAAAD